MESELTNLLTPVSFEKTPLVEISAKAAAIEALGWREYDRLPHRWIVKYEKVVAQGGSHTGDGELEMLMGDYWVDSAEIPAHDLMTDAEHG